MGLGLFCGFKGRKLKPQNQILITCETDTQRREPNAYGAHSLFALDEARCVCVLWLTAFYPNFWIVSLCLWKQFTDVDPCTVVSDKDAG